jgi:NAD+ synthetase
MWDEGYAVHPGSELREAGASVLVCISASPYRPGTFVTRLRHARQQGLPFLFVNAVGATDELVFDGRSFALDDRGNVVAALPAFEEAVVVVDLSTPASVEVPAWPVERELFFALALGVRDFAQKNGIRHAVLGLSGGIDSTLVACIAAEALGPRNVTAVAMPSRYTDPRSTECARALADGLGIAFEAIPIDELHTAGEATLGGLLEGARGGVAAENLQARLRMLLLTTVVNSRGGVLLNTSNKTELALGYGTLYGDMAGTLSVVGDLTKPQIYAVARWYDSTRNVIPRFVLDRPPSAELRYDQVDPFDYPVVAPVVDAIVRGEGNTGGDADVASLARSIHSAEHKRWQSGIVLKVSEKAFGTGRMVPVTHSWRVP